MESGIILGMVSQLWVDGWIPDMPNYRPLSTPPPKRHLFNSEETQSIINIPLSITDQGDAIVWHFSKDGEYTVKSGYYSIANSRMVDDNTVASASSTHINWKALWKL